MRHFVKIYIVLLWMWIGLLVSCQVETLRPPGLAEGDAVEVTFNITIGEKETRGLTLTDENHIEEIDILVFKEGFFVERAWGEDIESSGPTENPTQVKTFKAQLTTNNASNNTLVVVANARDAINKIRLKGSKNMILNQLVFDNHAPGGRWPAKLDGSTEFRPIPMYGESPNVKIDKNLEGYLKTNPILLYRALARIDLHIANSVTNFDLTELHFYKYNTVGAVAPGTDADWADYPYDTSNNPVQRVRNVTIPTGATPVEDFLSYNVLEKSFTSSIYVLEVDRTTPDNYPDATCLIVGGIFNGDLSTSYYRIDFEIVWKIQRGDPATGITEEVVIEAGLNQAGTARTFARILRNHIYEITVTKVSGSGAASREEALTQTSSRLEVKAATWTNRTLNIKFE